MAAGRGKRERAHDTRWRRVRVRLNYALATILATALATSFAIVMAPVRADAAATTFTVNTTADHADDGCAPLPGDCTLREAIAASNATTADVDTTWSKPSIS